MKKVVYLFAALAFMFASCDDESGSDPLMADFEITVEGEAPNARLNIVNSSTGAEAYEWEFSEGSSIESSTADLPSGVTVDKAGTLTVKLLAINGTEQDEVEKTVTIGGNSAILEITDVEFSQLVGDESLGRFYSISEQKMYLDSEISSSNGGLIDLFYKGGNSSFILFDSPAENFDDIDVPNGKTTKVHNYQSGFEVSTFDEMEDDSSLSVLTVVNDDSAIGSLDFPLIVLFETAEGRIGAIKLKQINSTRLVVDIKVQKY